MTTETTETTTTGITEQLHPLEEPVTMSATERRRLDDELGTLRRQRQTSANAVMVARGRAERAEEALRVARIELSHATAEITDGRDTRLVPFWQRAMETAEEENYCEEYDRMAEALGGPRREREFDVRATVTVTLSIPLNYLATSEEEAREGAEDRIDNTVITEHVANYGIEDWELYSTEVE